MAHIQALWHVFWRSDFEPLWCFILKCQDRVASLLKKDIKADVLSQSSSKKNKDENMAGLFCGEK